MRVFRPNNHAGSLDGEPGSAGAEHRRLSGSTHSRRIKRATAAQKTLRFALAPPIHEDLRACLERFRARGSQLLASSDQGRMTSSFKAMLKPETERPIQEPWAWLSSYENLRASRSAGSQRCVFSVHGMT